MIKRPKIEATSKHRDEIQQNINVKNPNLNSDNTKCIGVKVDSECVNKDDEIEQNVCKHDKVKCDTNDKVLSLVCDYSSSGESSD